MHITHVKYSGRLIDQDTVVWFDVPFEELLTSYWNTGDICVYDSTLKLMGERAGGFDLNIDKPVDQHTVKQLRDVGSILLLRGSNYIHEEMKWGYFADWLEALQLPVIACGVGAQAEQNRPIYLSEENLRVWKLISELSTTIGVRGSFSAETLHLNGIHNVEIVGCPSIFRARDRGLRLRHIGGEVNRVTLSLRREVDHMYSLDQTRFRAAQKRILVKLSMVSDLYLSCHGEPEEKAFFFRSPQHRDRATASLTAEGWFDKITGDLIRELYETKLYYASCPGDYDAYAKQFDVAVGYRVHAILPAIAVGTPSAIFDYDTRSRELAETFDIPIYSPEQFESLSLIEAFAPWRFEAFERNFADRYDRMKAFFGKNGMSARM